MEGNGTNSHGVHGSSEKSFGVYGTSEGAAAIYGYSVSQTGVIGYSGNYYGVAGSSGNNHGVVGATSSSNHFDFFAASTGGNNFGTASSSRWKEAIRNVPDPLQMISQIRGVYYNWDVAHGGKHAIGFIAEEVGAVLPEIVVYEENGIDAPGLDYSKVTPLLVESINAMRAEYQNKISHQAAQIASLRSELLQLRNLIESKSLPAND